LDELIGFISTVGFPIVVALYSLIRLETTVKENTKVMIAIAAKMGVDSIDSK
jgi:hypothetical protein